MDKEYYYKLNHYDIELCDGRYIMIHKWAQDFSHKWGIFVYVYDDKEGYWKIESFEGLNENDWIALGTLINLGFRWIKELNWE